jgi:Fur family ferric uptake transcriptional regulator
MSSAFEKYYLHVKLLFKELGYKESFKRKCLLQILFEEKRFLHVNKLKELSLKKYNEQIAISSIYKELRTLKNLHLIKILEIENKNRVYGIDFEPKKEYLICIRCNKVVELDNNGFIQSAQKISQENGFEFVDYKLNLYGYCEECSNESDKN